MNRILLLLLLLTGAARATTPNDYIAHANGTLADGDVILFEKPDRSALYSTTALNYKTYVLMNSVLTTNTYTDPAWIGSLAGSKITGPVDGLTFATATGTLTIGNGTQRLAVTGSLTLAGTGTLNINGGGTLGTGAFAPAYTLPPASTGTLGGVKVDGTTVMMTNGTLSLVAGIGFGQVLTVGQGYGITIDATDPANPIVSSSFDGTVIGPLQTAIDASNGVISFNYAAGHYAPLVSPAFTGSVTINGAGLSAVAMTGSWSSLIGAPSGTLYDAAGAASSAAAAAQTAAQSYASNASNLSSGTVAFARLPTGTTSSTVAAGNDARFLAAGSGTLTIAGAMTGSGSNSGTITTTLAADQARANLTGGTGTLDASGYTFTLPSATIALFDAAGAASTAQTAAQTYASNASNLASGTVAFARLPTGTTSSTVAAGNDARFAGAAQTANNGSDFASALTTAQNLGVGYSQVIAESANFTAGTRGAFYNVTTGTSTITVTLPTASNGMFFAVRKADSGSGVVVVNGKGLGTIGNRIEVTSDGTSFFNNFIGGTVDATGNFTYTTPANANYNVVTSGTGTLQSNGVPVTTGTIPTAVSQLANDAGYLSRAVSTTGSVTLICDGASVTAGFNADNGGVNTLPGSAFPYFLSLEPAFYGHLITYTTTGTVTSGTLTVTNATGWDWGQELSGPGVTAGTVITPVCPGSSNAFTMNPPVANGSGTFTVTNAFNQGVGSAQTLAGAAGGQTTTGSWTSAGTTTITLLSTGTTVVGPMTVSGAGIPAGDWGQFKAGNTQIVLHDPTTSGSGTVTLVLGGNNITDRYSLLRKHRPTALGGDGGSVVFNIQHNDQIINDVYTGSTTGTAVIASLTSLAANKVTDGFKLVLGTAEAVAAPGIASPTTTNNNTLSTILDAIRSGTITGLAVTSPIATPIVADTQMECITDCHNLFSNLYATDHSHWLTGAHLIAANFYNGKIFIGSSVGRSDRVWAEAQAFSNGITLRTMPSTLDNNISGDNWSITQGGKINCSGGTVLAGNLVMQASLQIQSPQSNVVASGTGTITFAEPISGTSIKMATAHLNGVTGTGTYTFPTAFTNPPHELGSGGIFTAITATGCQVTGTGTQTLDDALIGY